MEYQLPLKEVNGASRGNVWDGFDEFEDRGRVGELING
jgi:hypothetical protein